MTNILIFIAGQAILIIGGLIGIYVKVSLKLKELEIRVHVVEKQDDQISRKLDTIAQQLNQLSIQLQNKQDRE
jgi:short-subunit dehydrogenase involved in D-alanine esterification of teichoic acids